MYYYLDLFKRKERVKERCGRKYRRYNNTAKTDKEKA